MYFKGRGDRGEGANEWSSARIKILLRSVVVVVWWSNDWTMIPKQHIQDIFRTWVNAKFIFSDHLLIYGAKFVGEIISVQFTILIFIRHPTDGPNGSRSHSAVFICSGIFARSSITYLWRFSRTSSNSPQPTEVGIDKARQTPVRVIVKFIRRLHPNLVLLPSVLKSCCTTPEMLSNFVAAVKSLWNLLEEKEFCKMINKIFLFIMPGPCRDEMKE